MVNPNAIPTANIRCRLSNTTPPGLIIIVCTIFENTVASGSSAPILNNMAATGKTAIGNINVEPILLIVDNVLWIKVFWGCNVVDCIIIYYLLDLLLNAFLFS
ncbi:Hypothetical protein MCYN_0226 [Mycoplasmopsis cynos C142]|uniref:Uncharacterized protein n=1 Tax=Mycoplasmopsis cynos (strain C142) TaxID=1246955 RepID=L0RUD2_MYCC1|nr:Hypothetical protein MCYN_0226 [Mycoplasmopsis cynos C142]